MTSAKPSLPVMSALERIVATIKDGGGDLTATSIVRALSLERQAFDEAASYGRSLGVLKYSKGAWYRAVKDYVIPEEAYYDCIESALRDAVE